MAIGLCFFCWYVMFDVMNMSGNKEHKKAGETIENIIVVTYYLDDDDVMMKWKQSVMRWQFVWYQAKFLYQHLKHVSSLHQKSSMAPQVSHFHHCQSEL